MLWMQIFDVDSDTAEKNSSSLIRDSGSSSSSSNPGSSSFAAVPDGGATDGNLSEKMQFWRLLNSRKIDILKNNVVLIY